MDILHPMLRILPLSWAWEKMRCGVFTWHSGDLTSYAVHACLSPPCDAALVGA